MESPLCPPSDPGFRLIETMRWEPGRGLLHRDRHLARLARSAARLGITPRDVEKSVSDLCADNPLRVRLTVDAAGHCAIATARYVPLPHGTIWTVALADTRVGSGDPWLGVKTTQRQIYETARANLPVGVDEVLFLNERAELCEGTITNLFVDLGAGLVTPPVCSGVLPGILREDLIVTGRATEAVLKPNDLANARALYVGNALRGLIPAQRR